MTDEALLAKKLAALEHRVRDLRQRARPDAVLTDVEHRGYVERALQVCVQTAMDIASHIVSDAGLGEPRRNRDLFELLAGAGWVKSDLVPALVRMVGFRNILVHGYEVVDPKIVQRVVTDHLGDLDAFAAAVRARLATDA